MQSIKRNFRRIYRKSNPVAFRRGVAGGQHPAAAPMHLQIISGKKKSFSRGREAFLVFCGL